MQTEKKIERNKHSYSDLGDNNRQSKIHVIGVLEGGGKVGEKILAPPSKNHLKHQLTQPRRKKTPRWINTLKTILGPNIAQLLNLRYKEIS